MYGWGIWKVIDFFVWSWEMNKLYQIEDDLNSFQKKFRFDKNLALSKLQSA